MMETARSLPRHALESALQRSFVEGAAWPVGPAALAALIDMGLSKAQIAQYFGVETLAVRALRRSYGFMV
ncbi:MAG: hypothetical protein ACT4N4_03835 [Rhodospirillales bacterium]